MVVVFLVVTGVVGYVEFLLGAALPVPEQPADTFPQRTPLAVPRHRLVKQVDVPERRGCEHHPRGARPYGVDASCP